MQINGIGNFGETSESTSSQKNKELGKEEFLRLLVTQLRFQDPLKPMEDREFIAQLAQFNSLEQMINLNKSFAQLLSLSQLTQASSLIGKEVSGTNIDGEFSGLVEKVSLLDGEVYLKIGEKTVSLSDINTIG
jgi:flagellar basal-body rod modification protein FlgD